MGKSQDYRPSVALTETWAQELACVANAIEKAHRLGDQLVLVVKQGYGVGDILQTLGEPEDTSTMDGLTALIYKVVADEAEAQ